MAGGTFACGMTLDRYLRYRSKASDAGPKNRLIPMLAGTVLVPAGLLLYGWAAETRLHWIAPILGTGILSTGLAATQISCSSYLVDVFGVFAASAVAANLVVRYLTSTLLPLAGQALLNTVGVGWMTTVLSLTALIAAPIPWVVVKYGARLRDRYEVCTTLYAL